LDIKDCKRSIFLIYFNSFFFSEGSYFSFVFYPSVQLHWISCYLSSLQYVNRFKSTSVSTSAIWLFISPFLFKLFVYSMFWIIGFLPRSLQFLYRFKSISVSNSGSSYLCSCFIYMHNVLNHRLPFLAILLVSF